MEMTEIKKYNTNDLVDLLQENLELDCDDLKIIRDKKVTGRAFFKLTENKLEKWGMPSGSAIAIVDLINELKDNEKEFPSKPIKVEDSEEIKMSIPDGLSSYFCSTNFDNWAFIDCLEYLAKVCERIRSEDRDEIINQYKVQLCSISSRPWVLQRVKNKATKLIKSAEATFKRKDAATFFERLDIKADTNDIHNLVNDTNNLVSAKENLVESKLKVSAYDKIIEAPMASPTEYKRKRKYHEDEDGLKTPPHMPTNINPVIHTPNKRQMYHEDVIHYLDAMGQSLQYDRSHVQTPSIWKKIENYLENALKKSGEDFKEAIMLKIEGDIENKLRLYCEKILIDFYNLVDVFPNLSRNIGERKYIVQNLSSLFKFYETTFGNITIDWIESYSLSAKLTKSPTSSGIVKLDAKGIRLYDDKEVWHMEVAGPPSSPTTDHAVGDTKKSLHCDILNLVAILLDHLDIPLKIATNIKVFSLQAIGYRITLYSLSMSDNGSFLASELASAVIPFSFEGRSKYKTVLYLMTLFHDEFMKQLSIMQELDFIISHNDEVTVRDVLKMPQSLQDLLQRRQYL